MNWRKNCLRIGPRLENRELEEGWLALDYEDWRILAACLGVQQWYTDDYGRKMLSEPATHHSNSLKLLQKAAWAVSQWMYENKVRSRE